MRNRLRALGDSEPRVDCVVAIGADGVSRYCALEEWDDYRGCYVRVRVVSAESADRPSDAIPEA